MSRRVQLSHADIIDLYHSLLQFKEVKHTKLAYIVQKNMKRMKPHVDLISELTQVPDGYVDFENARNTLCDKHCVKDADGKPVIVDNKFQIADRKIFDEEFEKLKLEYQSELDNYKNNIMMSNDALQEIVDLDILTICIDALPDNLSMNEVSVLDIFITLKRTVNNL